MGHSPDATRLGELRATLSELEGQLKDPKVEKQKQAAEEAAKKSRQFVREVRRRQSEIDGTHEREWERQRQATHAAF